ncbi:MAG: glutathionylspermidine synthase family protein, partial [Saprospiraceae bacterium]|nr:glutathionylspermidine synthase family protein [Saprospiraceae bacterium]
MPAQVFRQLGWEYFISEEAENYLSADMVHITAVQQDAYADAANTLYDMMVQTGEYILQKNLLRELGIPANMHELIRLTWEDERNLHLFGRFDFAGGTSGLPVKMLEFNADTPTSLPETAIIQWAQLEANGIAQDKQFNFVYEALIDQFRRLRSLNPEREPAILFSTLRGAPEDDHNVALLREAATEAGFETAFAYVDEVVFSDINGIFAPGELGNQPLQFPFWFKLVPWEYIAFDEPELCTMLTNIVRRGQAVVLNPAYTLMFQSKAFLKYLWDLFPEHPLLLETSLEEPIGRSNYPFVQKVIFGREGSNVTVYDDIGLPLEVRGGEYENQTSVFQAFAQLDRDE